MYLLYLYVAICNFIYCTGNHLLRVLNAAASIASCVVTGTFCHSDCRGTWEGGQKVERLADWSEEEGWPRSVSNQIKEGRYTTYALHCE